MLHPTLWREIHSRCVEIRETTFMHTIFQLDSPIVSSVQVHEFNTFVLAAIDAIYAIKEKAVVALVLQSINRFVLSTNVTEKGVIHSSNFSFESNASVFMSSSTG